MTTTLELTIAEKLMKDVMDTTILITRAVSENKFERAHKLRDELYTFTVGKISRNINHFSKKQITETLQVLVNIDDWGV